MEFFFQFAKQFVRQRVENDQKLIPNAICYVPTADKPDDVLSRGCWPMSILTARSGSMDLRSCAMDLRAWPIVLMKMSALRRQLDQF